MKPLTVVAAVAGAALSMVACDRASDISGPQMSPPSRPVGEVIHSKTNERNILWVDQVENCDGDPVIVQGQTHVIMTETIDSNGGYHRSWRFISKGTGFEATDVLMVKPYKIDETTLDSQNVSDDQATFTNEERLLVLAPRGEDNFIYHRVTKYTIPANGSGEPSAQFDRSWAKCVG